MNLQQHTTRGVTVLDVVGRVLTAMRAYEAGSRFVLCGVSGRVRQLFELAGLLDLFSIMGTREEGLAAAAG